MRLIYCLFIFTFSACEIERTVEVADDESNGSSSNTSALGKKDSSQPSVIGDAVHGPIDMETKEDIGKVLATVDGEPIGSKAYKAMAKKQLPADGKRLSADERLNVLNEMIKDELIFREAMNQELYRDARVRKVLENALMQRVVHSKIKPSDYNEEDIKEYYNSNKEEFTQPEKVQFSRIMIKIKGDRDEAGAKSEAERIAQALNREPTYEKFKSLAEKFSDGPYKRLGGHIGWVSREKGKRGIEAEVIDRAFNLGKGKISAVFQTPKGFHIVMLKERRAAIERSFAQMKGLVLRKLQNAKRRELFFAYIDQLKDGKEIVIDDEKLNSLEIKPSKEGLRTRSHGGEH